MKKRSQPQDPRRGAKPGQSAGSHIDPPSDSSSSSRIQESEAEQEKIILLPSDMKKRESLNKNFYKEFVMSDKDTPKGVGLDVGTSFLVAGRFDANGSINFNKIRDCFLHIPYKTPINRKMIKRGLDDRGAPYITQPDGFYVLGEDAFNMANERHQNTRRPMSRGVLSPKEKAAFPILKELIGLIIGKPKVEN